PTRAALTATKAFVYFFMSVTALFPPDPSRPRMVQDPDASGGERFLAGFGLLSLAAVAVGCAVAAAHGVAAGSWARNLAAWGVGGVVAWVAAARASRLSAVLLIAP